MNQPAPYSLLPTSKVIAHVDLDAFYSQVEVMRDLGRLKGKPVGVVQYNPRGDLTTLPPEADRLVNNSNGSLIAVNYIARSKGVKRGHSGNEARALCPDIQLVQVPVKHQKADLTPYRDAGKRVLQILARKSICQRASIDECYLDITKAAQERLEHSNGVPQLPLHQHSIHVYDHNGHDIEAKDWWQRPYEDWNAGERLLACGAAVVSELRAAVEEELGYTCSAGIAHTRLLSKLCSGLHKPAQQTLLPAVSVQALLHPLPISKLQGLGGQFGSTLTQNLNIHTVGDLASLTLNKLESIPAINEKDARWLYNMARGIDDQDVEERKLPKSVSCGKTFRGNAAIINTEIAYTWLLELAAELEERLSQDKEENYRTPTLLTVNIGFIGIECAADARHGFHSGHQHVSRSCSLKKTSAEAMAHDALGLIRKWSSEQSTGWKIVDLFLGASHFVPVQSTSITQFFKSVPAAKTQEMHSVVEQEIKEEKEDTGKKIHGHHDDDGARDGGEKEIVNAQQPIQKNDNRGEKETNLSSGIDESVLAELPLEIQKEIKAQMKMKQMMNHSKKRHATATTASTRNKNGKKEESSTSNTYLMDFLKGKKPKKTSSSS